jgi:hypothetical protein
MARGWLALLLLAGCGGSTPASPGEEPEAPAGGAIHGLRDQKVSGHVVAADGSVHPDEGAARADTAPERVARALQHRGDCDGFHVPFTTWSVVADHGDVVEVEGAAEDARACAPSWLGIRGFVRKQDLVAVVRKAIRREHADKSGVAIVAGAPVDVKAKTTWHPATSIDVSDVALSFESVEAVPQLFPLAAMGNACSPEPPPPAPPDAFGEPPGRPACFLHGGHSTSDDAPVDPSHASGTILVDGTGQAQTRVGEVAIHERVGDGLLVTLSSECGALRGIAAPSNLGEQGLPGCGYGGGGGEPQLFRVSHPATLLWADGSQAGVTLKHGPLQRGRLKTRGDVACFIPRELAAELCVTASALK